MTPDLYETYLRDKDGRAYEPESFRKGVEQFLSEDGYRISFNIEGVVFTLRHSQVSDELRFLDDHLAQESLDCAVTIRGLRLQD